MMTEEEMLNSILATGAVMACLYRAPTVRRVEPITVDGQVTNELLVTFDFLRSSYKVTIEIDHD